MRKIHLTLILIATLWSVLPAGSPFRSLFGLAVQEPAGDITTQADPETDPIMISIPPPRRQ